MLCSHTVSVSFHSFVTFRTHVMSMWAGTCVEEIRRQFDRTNSNKGRWWVMITQNAMSCSFFSFSWDTICLFSCVCVLWVKLAVMELSHINPSELCSWGSQSVLNMQTQTHLWRWIFVFLHSEKAWNQVRHDDKHSPAQFWQLRGFQLRPRA